MTMLPPGPRGTLLPLFRYMRDPFGSTLRLFEQYGDPHTLRFLGAPMVSTCDPRLIRTILSADPDTYEAWGTDVLGPILGKESLLVLSGERHKAARKLLMPPFNAARMRAYGRAMQAITQDEMQRLRGGAPFSMQHAAQAISLRIILRAVFGITDSGESALYEREFVEGVGAVTPSLIFLKVLRREFGGLGPWAKIQRHARRTRELMDAEIAERRASPETREDVLSLLMAARYDDGGAMTNEQLFETLVTLVVAGHETSAISAAWGCYFVHRSPPIRAKLLAELHALPEDAEPEAIAKLPYLTAVCEEALRLNPVAPNVMRVLKRPLVLGAWPLPAGVIVNPSILALHRDPEIYPEPEVFRPERFLERDFSPYEYLPFGGGHRRCIGAAFALYEMKIILATFLREPSLRLVTDTPVGVKMRSTVLGPDRPIEFSLS